mgnify:CR=1 FL=1
MPWRYAHLFCGPEPLAAVSVTPRLGLPCHASGAECEGGARLVQGLRVHGFKIMIHDGNVGHHTGFQLAFAGLVEFDPSVSGGVAFERIQQAL